MSRRNDTQLGLAALKTAIKGRTLPFGLLHHTDRSSPYASDEYQAALKANGVIVGTMPWRNRSSVPSKSDLALDDADLTPELVRAQVTDYIDNFYNPERRHSTLDYFSPIE